MDDRRTDSEVEPQRPADLHEHVHRHGDEQHGHAHHHRAGAAEAHEHAHAQGFERYAYLTSPVHALDPRFKILSVLALIVAVVAGPPLRVVEFAAVGLLLATVTLLARIPLGWMLKRSALVLPVALGIALFAPLGHVTQWSADGVAQAYREYGWLVWAIASKAWVSTYLVLLVSATTPTPRLFKALKAMRVPSVFLTMLTFLHRYADVLRDQLRSMRRALASRGFNVTGWQRIRLYGNLSGNLFIRAYERGERIHASMLARGYDGTLPTAEVLTARPADWLALATALVAAAAVALY